MLAQALALHSVVPQRLMANDVSQPQFSPFFFVPSPSKFLIDGLLNQKSLLAKVVRISQITWVMQFEESIGIASTTSQLVWCCRQLWSAPVTSMLVFLDKTEWRSFSHVWESNCMSCMFWYLFTAKVNHFLHHKLVQSFV